jgi:hypothetical protein
MSRTYRLRRLPKLGGQAPKFVDASIRTAHREVSASAGFYYAHVLHAVPCLVGESIRAEHWKCCWGAKVPLLSYGYERVICAALDLVPAVASVACHPWVRSQWVKNASKRWECKRGHRAGRRHDKRLLHGFQPYDLYDDLSLAVKHECGLLWSADDEWLDMEGAFAHPRYWIDPWSWD